MKKLLFYLTITLFSILTVAQTANYNVNSSVTRYYTQLKIVSQNGQETKGDNSGQFITFNDKGCYDSDKKGFSVDNGFLKYATTNNDRVIYSGDSYWGRATYIFASNYGRLNIRVGKDGATYVYVLAKPTQNVQTCALIRGQGGSSNTQTPIIIINPRASSNCGGNYNGSNTSTKRICPGCNGTGKGMDQIIYSPNYTGQSNDRYCGICGKTTSAHTHHTPTCKVCNGRGYID